MATVTIGITTYDVYSNVSDADDYFNGSADFLVWSEFTADEKARGLVSSTRLIDRQAWLGEKAVASPENILDFPRSGLTDCSGDAVTENNSLSLVVEASQLLALDILAGETVETSSTTEDLTKRLKAGSVAIENFRAAIGTATRFPLDVMELIGCFLGSGVKIAGSIDSGTDGEALDDDFSLIDGF